MVLVSHVKSILGVNISAAMVGQYNKCMDNQGIPPTEMLAVCMELSRTVEELDGMQFDVIIVSQFFL